MVPQHLTCEHLNNPLGIGIAQPRLSWELRAREAALRGLSQRAYQIRVASSPARLTRGVADLWDSGRVRSDESVDVVYAGRALASHQECFWQVRVWDQDGRPSAWSRPAWWTMGLLRPEDWSARWIGHTQPPGERPGARGQGRGVTFDGAQWIWSSAGDAKREVPAGTLCFRRSFDLPEGELTWARMVITVDDRFVLYVNGAEALRTEGPEPWRQARQVDLAPHLRAGPNVIAIRGTNDALSPAGAIAALTVVTGAGETRLVTDGQWRCGPESPGWESTDFDDSAWAKPVEIGAMGAAPWGGIRVDALSGWGQEQSSPLFRKTVELGAKLRRATATICGLGYYELRMNGEKIGDHVLDPMFTRYDKRALYVTYDVTRSLHRGQNAIGVMLGNGFYNQHARDAWDFERAPWRAQPALRMQLRLEFADGTTRTVGTDETWRANTGPVVLDGIRNGEFYDARREWPGWDRAYFDDSEWPAAELVDGPKGALCAQMMPPIRVMETIAPIGVAEPKPGVFIFDLGQTIAGWAQIRVSGHEGTQVVLRYGEQLAADGMLDRGAIATLVYQGPFQTDSYTLAGRGVEKWEPRFTYHGFRYVEVTGWPGRPDLDSLRGRVVHTGFARAGSFECSNELLNTIQRLTLWAYRGNFVGIPTDCPHREKNGWTGDAQLACELGLLNFDNAPAYEKWMGDFRDEQPASGEFAGIIPTSGWGYGIGPAWDSAHVLIPWYLYVYRGDRRVLEDNYASMKRYVDFLGTRARDGIVDYGLADWCPAKTETSAAVTSTAYYYVDALTLSRIAELLGQADDAKRYADIATGVFAAFNRAHNRGDGIYANGSQTALACALYQGLVPPEQREQVAQRLAEAVEANDWHLDCGILGAKYLFRALTDAGRADVAYRIATQTTAPSYGDWIARGATTLWEDWGGGASRDHIMFGDISAWFYSALAGIDPDPRRPGFRHTTIHPHPVGDLTWVRAQHEGPYGTVGSAWELGSGGLTLKVSVPPNTTATVYVPAASADVVTEGEHSAAQSPGVVFLGERDGCAVFEVGSGEYAFGAKGE